MLIKPYFYVLSLFLGLSMVILQLSWTPHYPAKATVFFQPKWLMIQSPISGVVAKQNVSIGEEIEKGQEIIRIQSMSYLLHQSAIQEQLKSIQEQHQTLEQERRYQLSLIEHLRDLAQKKMLAVQDFHEKQQQYQKIVYQQQQLFQQLQKLKRKSSEGLQSPISGTLVKYFVREGEKLEKDQSILLIKPKKFQYWVRLKLPIGLQHYTYIGQKIHLSEAGSVPLKSYPIHAEIREISSRVKHDGFVVRARILNEKDFSAYLWDGLSLDAYLLGRPHPLSKWIEILLKGVS